MEKEAIRCIIHKQLTLICPPGIHALAWWQSRATPEVEKSQSNYTITVRRPTSIIRLPNPGRKRRGVVRFCKPDGKGGIYDRTEDNLIACTLGKDTITVRLAAQMLTCPGDVVADVAIICGTTIISTFNFIVAVQANPAAGITPSHSYYNYRSLADINQAINEAKAAAAGAVKFVNGVKPGSDGNGRRQCRRYSD